MEKTIYIGTLNRSKIKAIKNILKEMKLKYNVREYNVSSNISNIPFGEKETIMGAVNRAKNVILNSENKKDYAIGIENGIIEGYTYKDGNIITQYYDQTIVVLIDHYNNYYTGKGPEIPIPFEDIEIYKDEINNFRNGDYLDYFQKYYTNNLLNRERTCEYALRTIIGNII